MTHHCGSKVAGLRLFPHRGAGLGGWDACDWLANLPTSTDRYNVGERIHEIAGWNNKCLKQLM